MTLNASVQSAALGVASFVGGQIISQEDVCQGLVRGYWQAALVGAVASLAAWWLAPRPWRCMGRRGKTERRQALARDSASRFDDA